MWTVLRFSKEQRVLLVDKLPDLAQVAVGALVFGQFLGERPFSYMLAAAGYVVWIALMSFALYLAGQR